MKIISPILDIEEEATIELIEDVVRNLEGKKDPFAILAQSELTYIQILWTPDGYDIEYQENDIFHHYRAKDLISQEDAIWVMQSYLKGELYWKSKFEFEMKKIATSAYKFGYNIGRFFGKIAEIIKSL